MSLGAEVMGWGACGVQRYEVLWVEQDVPDRCGCADMIVPAWKLLDEIRYCSSLSQRKYSTCKDTGPPGNAGQEVLECGCLVNSLNINRPD